MLDAATMEDISEASLLEENELIIYTRVQGKKVSPHSFLGRIAPLIALSAPDEAQSHVARIVVHFFSNFKKLLNNSPRLESKTVMMALKIILGFFSFTNCVRDIVEENPSNSTFSPLLKFLLSNLSIMENIFEAMTARDILGYHQGEIRKDVLQDIIKACSDVLKHKILEDDETKSLRTIISVCSNFYKLQSKLLCITRFNSSQPNILERALFHPSFFGIYYFKNPKVKAQWLQKKSSSLQQLSTDTCAICVEEFEPKPNTAVMSGCPHIFHTQCLESWFTSKKRYYFLISLVFYKMLFKNLFLRNTISKQCNSFLLSILY